MPTITFVGRAAVELRYVTEDLPPAWKILSFVKEDRYLRYVPDGGPPIQEPVVETVYERRELADAAGSVFVYVEQGHTTEDAMRQLAMAWMRSH